MPYLLKMKKTIHIHIFFITILLSGICFSKESHAQNTTENYMFGKAALSDGDYYSAMFYLNKAIKEAPDNYHYAYKLAEASRLAHAYTEAEKWYEFVKKKAAEDTFPLLLINLGEVKKRLAKYDEALALFERSDKKESTPKTQQRIASVKFAQELINDTIKVAISPLERNINTPYSEFNPYPLHDTILYFSSLRPFGESSRQALINPSYTTKIYKSVLRISGWTAAVPLESSINQRNTHNANVCFNPEGNTMYFSRCNELTPSNMRCHLYKSEKKDNCWGTPQKLEGDINLDGYTSTQPSYGRMEDANDVLFFVSDRPGGQGGLDIWYSVIHDNTYQAPINLGSFINTPGDEISPFFHIPTQTLYFSSNWHEGLGGFDIFKTKGYYNTWQEPENLGFPINTSYNEMYYVPNEEYPEAYLTSNRPGALQLTGEACCNDIFFLRFKEEEKEIIEEDTLVVELEEKVRDLLPLALYFHNDKPDPRTLLKRSQRNYKETMDAYLDMLDTYIVEYSAGLEGSAKKQAKQDIKDFFNNYVTEGYQKLNRFAAWLSEDLEAGNTVQITIRGYCSPLNTSDYNINLSKRRISTLINFFREYDNGRLVPYLEETAENQARLKIFEEPLGDSKANPIVSDNPHDIRNSIYSRAAALERKVEIVEYISLHDSLAVSDTEITFAQTIHDLGNVAAGEKKELAVTFHNTGNAPLRISNIETTSSLLKATLTANDIMPGDSSDIHIVFNPKNITGHFKEYVSLSVNTKERRVSLTVKAFVEKETE